MGLISTDTARNYVRRIAGNQHDSLKWAWTVVIGATLIQSANRFAENRWSFARCFGLADEFTDFSAQPATRILIEHASCDMSLALHSLMFLGFVMTVLRFYWGDSRLLDAKYRDTFLFFGDIEGKLPPEWAAEEFVRILSNLRTWFLMLDCGFMIIHGIIIALLAQCINDPIPFLLGYVFLLTVNSGWLLLGKWTSKTMHYVNFWDQFLSPESVNDITGKHAPVKWALNNLFHAGSILLLLLCMRNGYFTIPDKSVVLIAAVFVISNSIVDFLATRHAYFPRLAKIYGDMTEDQAEPTATYRQ